ncbi:SMI1/KNR4 family protein [Capnocytophaga sp. Marseille-Q4570]|uniref:SMI1/KNR4 family protein n=1 Tax=Capnocytophaga bilenii TaxID=2819369 RepID=A0ABS3PWV0_9FLAO|nr:SMI1/KNR4 family protein [Capnocytophaga bilenii]MBO1883813.1 SMI1/KNR4 family protein [Capnocytophaga bilenii]
MQIDDIKKKMLFLLAHPNTLKSIVPKEVFINPTISEEEVSEIEKRNNIILPKDYREFIIKIGNGCIGPRQGLLSLQESMFDFKLRDNPAINLSKPFAYNEKWNEDEWIDAIDWDGGERPDDEVLEKYMSTNHITGCLQICHIGHGATYLLVVNGEEYGNMWLDGRIDYGGLKPLLNEKGERVSFISWFTEWLDEAVQM